MISEVNIGQRALQLVGGRRRLLTFAAVVAVAVIGLGFGATRTTYMQQIISVAFIYGILAISLDLVWGYTGILSMGHAVFFGLGAYAVGLFLIRVNGTGQEVLLKTHWWNFPAGLLTGVAVVVALALVVGALAFYGTGSNPFYVSVVTLALTVLLGTVLEQIAFLGGQQGLSGFPIIGIPDVLWYVICATALLAAWLLVGIVIRSDFGLLLRAIRDNEERCQYLGYDVARVKTVTFAGSAALAAVAGALYAGFMGFVSPPFVGFLVATNIIIWVAVGGRGTLLGPILGAIAVNIVGTNLSARFPYVWTLILGSLFVIVVVFVPEGVLPGGLRLVGWFRRQDRMTSPLPLQQRRLVSRAPLMANGYSPNRREDEVAMSVRNVYRAFGGLHVLKGVSLEILRGELLCIVGPNGAGKSTLLGVISDGSVRHQGEVAVSADEREVSLKGKAPGDVVRAGVGRKFQNPNVFESFTPLETVLLASRRGKIPSLWRRTKNVKVPPEVTEIFRATGLDAAENVVARDLAHGLKQALEVAMTVSLESAILLLDEPTAGLTHDERALIGDLLRTLVAQGITIVLIEHDFGFVRRIADRVAVLHDGLILEMGTVAEVADSDLVKRVYLGTLE